METWKLNYAQRHASDDETLLHIRQVNVEPTRIWATDGHRALILPANNGPEECGGYVDGVKLAAPAPPAPIDQVIPPADTPTLPTLTDDVVDRLRALATIVKPRTVLALSILASGMHITITEILPEKSKKKAAAKFETMLSNEPALHDTGLNVRYLLDAIDCLGFADDAPITLRQENPLAPIRIDGPLGTAVIMPMRI